MCCRSSVCARSSDRGCLGSSDGVTTTFTVMSVEQALRRLVQDHELMLVYSVPSDERVLPKLIQADVFASTPSAAQVRAASEMLGRQRAGLLAEIQRLARSRNVQHGAPRLAELLGTAPDAIVRAHAASALATLRGPVSQAALATALGRLGTQCACPGRSRASERGRSGSHSSPGRVLLTDPDVTVRRLAAQMLGSLQEPAATSALSAAAQDADALVRREVTLIESPRWLNISVIPNSQVHRGPVSVSKGRYTCPRPSDNGPTDGGPV